MTTEHTDTETLTLPVETNVVIPLELIKTLTNSLAEFRQSMDEQQRVLANTSQAISEQRATQQQQSELLIAMGAELVNYKEANLLDRLYKLENSSLIKDVIMYLMGAGVVTSLGIQFIHL